MTRFDGKKNWRRRKAPASDSDAVLSPVRRLARGALIYGLLVLLLTAFYSHVNQLRYEYVIWATPLGAFFGVAVRGFEELAAVRLRGFLARRCNRAICNFVLFFVYVISYILLFSFMVTYPAGHLLEKGSGSAIVALKYGLFTLNFILLFAILGWLDWRRVMDRAAPRFWGEAGRRAVAGMTRKRLTTKRNYI